jgi:23S rRNA (guanine745-N1)-methyltransferase
MSMERVSWRCPICHELLQEGDGGLGCRSGHRFDRAGEGYVNLLVGGRKPARAAGDSAAMIRARRAFFDRGHYRPIVDAVADAVAAAALRRASVLDAGCGDGTYLDGVMRSMTERGGEIDGLGIDVSKPAVRLAARRYGAARFAVASSYALPLADHTLDAVVTVFAPRSFAEFARVLRPDGIVVVASPGPDHLAGLKALLYDDPRAHAGRPHTAEEAELPYAPEQRRRVRFELTLDDPSDAANLLQMTPYWWHATEEQQRAVAASASLTTMVDVIVSTHHVRESSSPEP